MRALSRLKFFDHWSLLAPAPSCCALKLPRRPSPRLTDLSSSILNVAPALALADQSNPATNTPSGSARLVALLICRRTSSESQPFLHIRLSFPFALMRSTVARTCGSLMNCPYEKSEAHRARRVPSEV